MWSVILVLLTGALVALVTWGIRSLRSERPSAVRAQEIEATLNAEYDALRKHAATDPAAAAAFAERAADDLAGLRALAADFAKRAPKDPAAATTEASLRLQIDQVERDLAWARERALPAP